MTFQTTFLAPPPDRAPREIPNLSDPTRKKLRFFPNQSRHDENTKRRAANVKNGGNNDAGCAYFLAVCLKRDAHLQRSTRSWKGFRLG